MQKPGFSVVSMVCVLLGVFGLGLLLLRPFLPLQPANSMSLEADEYLRQGSNQQINWRLLNERALAEASRLERPIMLVMGTVGSRDARLADSMLFRDQDIQSYLSRNFVCVRVDLDAQPYWGNAFLPVSRARSNVQPSFQIWFIDPKSGSLFDYFGKLSSDFVSDPALFLDRLALTRETFESQPVDLQTDDRANFESASYSSPRIDVIVDALRQGVNPKWGGFPVRNTQYLRMAPVQLLLEYGDLELAQAAVDPMLKSGIVDWLDGGFFRRARKTNWTDIEYDKLALPNAEAMKVLAIYSVLLKDRFAERVAKNTFETLANGFSANGLVATARIGDENALMRSARSSFTAKDLRSFWGTGLLSGDEAVQARTMFGLTVETNPQMSLRVSDPSVFDAPQFGPILEKLRANKDKVKTKYSKTANAYVNGAVCAAMFFSARIWNDSEMLAHAQERFDSLSSFGPGSDITHHTLQRPEDGLFLGDYLGVSEACLEKYLADGDFLSVKRGMGILGRAQQLFTSANGWTPSTDRITALIPGSNYPQVVDGNNESMYARTIRLNNAYGRLLRGGEYSAQAGAFSQNAFDMVYRGNWLSDLGLAVAGYGAASLGVIDDAHAISVGPDAVALSNQLFQLVPTRLIAPAIGIVRQDLQKRNPGIYVIAGSQIDGPFNVDQAVSRLDWRHTIPRETSRSEP